MGVPKDIYLCQREEEKTQRRPSEENSYTATSQRMPGATRSQSRQGRILLYGLLKEHTMGLNCDIKFLKKCAGRISYMSYHPLDKNGGVALYPNQTMKNLTIKARGASESSKTINLPLSFSPFLDLEYFRHSQLYPRKQSQNVQQARQQVWEIKIQLPAPISGIAAGPEYHGSFGPGLAEKIQASNKARRENT